MSFQLKNYQQYVLRRLHEFLRLARISGAAGAYREVAHKNQNDDDYANPYAGQYQPIVEELDCPHVCIRVPTAGGKTFLAAHAIGHGATYMETEAPTVLWFTPTDAIRTQTTAMLQNRDHPCRIAIENRFGFDVVVYNIDEFDMIRPQDLSDRVCIIVSTAQMFARKETTRENDDGMTKATRRIYATHENLMPHFERFLPPVAPETLERDENGEPKRSFANLLHLVRPLVILDEAHRFVSDLSHKVLQRINPACVLEWTATPREKGANSPPLHNVLVNIPAQALYDEQMIKLPIVVSEHGDWEQAVFAAVTEQKQLEKVAADKGEAIRPIVLYQAQDKDEEVTVEKLKTHLGKVHNINADAIAVHTGSVKELDAAGDLLSADCKIKHVITVKALVEGWDCPFAYALCTVSNVASDTAIEQLLGRIMRMPNARHRAHEELNRAYVHVPETTPFAAAECLREKLADQLGFEEKETQWAVQESVLVDGSAESGLLGVKDIVVETMQPPDFADLPEEIKALAEKAVEIRQTAGVYNVVIKQPIPPAAQERIIAVVAEEKRAPEKRRLDIENKRLTIARSPAHCGEKFALMPTLFFYSSAQEKEIAITAEALYEVAQWNDLDDDCVIDNFAIKETAQTVEVHLKGGRVLCGGGKQYQIPLAEVKNSSNQKYLAFWLEEKIRDPQGRYLPVTLKKLVQTNLEALLKENSLEALYRAKYQFAEALKDRLSRHAGEIAEQTLTQCIFKNDSIECRPVFEFPPRGYQSGEKMYAGSFAFSKHYYHSIGGLENAGEEFECARAIDLSKHVRYWIRNLPQKKNSYSIPLGTNRNFYPDFVILLENGKTLILEYKGKHLANDPMSLRKKQMGEFIEHHSADCFFLMVTQADNLPSIAEQLETKVSEILRA